MSKCVLSGRRTVMALVCIALLVFSIIGMFWESSFAATSKKVIKVEMSIYVEAPHKKAFDLMEQAYEKLHPDIDLVFYGPPYAEFWDKLTTEIVAGTEADIVQLQAGNTYYARYASLRPGETGAFVNLDQYVKGTALEKDLLMQKDMTYNGHYIGLSNYAWGTRAVYYRKSLFKEAGVDPNGIITNEDFLQAAIKLTRKAATGKPARYGFGAVLSTHPFVFSEWQTFLAKPVGRGFYFPEEKGPYTPERVIVNSDPIVWAARWWQDMIFKYKVVPPGSYDKASQRDLFWNGTAAMNIDGPWFTGMTREYDPKLMDDVGIFATPDVLYNGKRYKSYGDVSSITHLISSNTKYPKEALEFLKWMASPEGQKYVAVCGMIPSNVNYARSKEYKESEPENSKFIEFLEKRYGPHMSNPNIPQLGEMEQIMVEAAQEMFIANKDAKTSLDRAAERIKKALAK